MATTVTLYDRDGNSFDFAAADFKQRGHQESVTAYGETDQRFIISLLGNVLNTSAAFIANSTDSRTIGTGSKSFTIEKNKPFFVGSYMRIEDAGNASNFMEGDVTAYDPDTGSLTVNVTNTGGSGTISDWKHYSLGEKGEKGDTGPAGTSVTISANDTTSDYLKNKLVAGSGVTLTEQNDGGNETLKVDAGGSPFLRDFVATGSISTGDVVALRSDGTVEVVSTTTFTEGVEDTAVFESANTDNISATYDSANSKVVIAYRDRGNSNYGTAIVGTVSGSSISFGTATVFESADTSDISAAYDSGNGKVVIAYADGGNGTAIVGTVSSTSISFGSATVFESTSASKISATYDNTANKVFIAYRDVGNSNYGTAIVGTVSSTSISFGSATVFESAMTDNIFATYDSDSDKVVIAYQDGGNSDYGTSVVWQTGYTATNADDWIGVSQASLSDTQTGTMALKGAVDENQSGLTANNTIYLADDGTLQTTDNGRKLGRALASDTILLASE
jgi:uncharacterized protein (UPF0248 family)